MSRRVLAAVSVALLSAAPAWSQFSSEEFRRAEKDPRAFTLDEKSIKIERIGGPLDKIDSIDSLPSLDQLVNLGLKLWKIIEENKPVVDIKTEFATALPKGAKNWTDMAGWQAPATAVYELSAKNGYGMRVIHVRYAVMRTYGGSYNGAGKYLTAVTVNPLLTEVAWGYHFALGASVPDSSIVNVGTAADPLAAMTVQLGWRISTVVKDSSGQSSYFVQGDGAFHEVAGPFAETAPAAARAKVAELEEKAPSFE